MRWSRVWWNEMRWSDVGWVDRGQGEMEWGGVRVATQDKLNFVNPHLSSKFLSHLHCGISVSFLQSSQSGQRV